MALIIRIWNVARGLTGRLVSYFESRNPEALLDVEKENLRKLIGRFNEGLVSHAALSEKLMTQTRRGEAQGLELSSKINALVKAGEREAAARYALQLKDVNAHLAEDRKQLESAETTDSQLVRTRESALAESRSRIEKVRRRIGDLKVGRALADLEGMANAMIGSLGSSGDSLNRLQDMVEDEHEKASARVRVASVHMEPADLRAREIEQAALASAALDEFLGGGEAQRALPDFSQERLPLHINLNSNQGAGS